MTKEEEKAFDFLQSVTLNLITVASGIITLGITFFEKLAKHRAGLNVDPSIAGKGVLDWSWITLCASVVCGFWSWFAQAGTLENPGLLGYKIYRPNIRLLSTLQILAFLAGLILTIVFGIKNAA